jgi:hypothetical protein
MASHGKPERKNHKRHYETPFYASPLEPESPRKHPAQVDKTGSAVTPPHFLVSGLRQNFAPKPQTQTQTPSEAFREKGVSLPSFVMS